MKKKHSVRNTILCLLAAAIIIIPTYLAIAGYMKNRPKLEYTFGTTTAQSMVPYPDTQFAVISDVHYYDKSLGTSGPAFESYKSSDRKLLEDSADLLDFEINNILKSGVKFVLMPGDLTKDGELLCHNWLADALSRLTQNGIKVYVIPGNHDVNNPGSFKYEGDQYIPVQNITPEQFANIYSNYGYGSAIYRDSNSLSYVAEPVNNLWLAAIDSCRYMENKPGGRATIGGKLSQPQEKWLEGILKKAREKGKAVIVMMHHGVVEHWSGQSKLQPDYLIEDYRYISRLLASYDVRLAFTGHYHSQDIALADFNRSGFIYDVETGSLVTPSCPVRHCTISGNKLEITSRDLVDDLHPGTSFAEDSRKFVNKTIENEIYKTLRKYLVPDQDAHYITNYVTAGFVAHYDGDENAAERPDFDKNKLGLWSRFVYSQQEYVVNGLWKDMFPADNNVIIDLGGK